MPAYLFIMLSALLYLQGCAETLPLQPLLPKEHVVITKPLESRDKAPSVSKLYQVPAPAMSREQQRLRFTAIGAMIQSGDYHEAMKQADSINQSALSDQEKSHLNLLYAQIRLSVGEAELAIENLNKIQPHLLSQEQTINYLQTWAFALSLTGKLLESAEYRIDLHSLLTSQEEMVQNQRAILETLVLLPDASLQIYEQSATGNLAGWLALAQIYRLKDQPDFNARLSQWREAFPGHPANTAQLTNHPAYEEAALHYPGSIAIILPGSGPFAAAAKAIKAGIMAAFDNLESSAYKPNLHFYDSMQATPADNYDQAIAAGAEMIIGPLDKKDIQSLADSVTLTVPVLALNHIQGLEQDNLYQFALNPVDDVEYITDKARQDGHKKALLLIPENPQTRRIAAYFKDYWQGGDKAIIKAQTYHPKATDFSLAIEKLLSLDESKPVDPEQMLPANQNSTQQQEADVLFISAYNAEARSIMQQLQLHDGADLAVYAMPNIYVGRANPARDSILNEITFCDMPWFFDSTYQGKLSMNSLTELTRQYKDSYLRLIAMGIDAFNLSARLNELDSSPYTGATGNLALTRDNRIKRELICAKYIDGKPKVTGFINRQRDSDVSSSHPSEESGPASKKRP